MDNNEEYFGTAEDGAENNAAPETSENGAPETENPAEVPGIQPEAGETPEIPEMPETPEPPHREQPSYAPREYPQPGYFNNLSRPAGQSSGAYSYSPGSYSMTGMNGGGGVSYAPVERNTGKKKKEKKKKGHAAGIAVLLIVCLLLSCGAGFAGSYLEKQVNGGASSDGGNRTVTLNVANKGGEDAGGKNGAGEKNADGYYSSAISGIRDSVVEISTEFKTLGFYQYIASGAGSGVIISEDGYVVTNNHVICKNDNMTVAETITVRTRDGRDYEAEVIGTDAQADVAVIKIDGEGFTAATFGDSDDLQVGDEVIAIGNPLGELGGTVTNGIISALAREVEVEGTKMNLLQTNAAINPGNSGGGLFNMDGELIGLVNAKSGGSNIEGLGFAIPVNDVQKTAVELIEKGYVGKTIIGVTLYEALTVYDAQRLGVNALGIYISDVTEGYNDDVLQRLDRIVEVNGVEIADADDVISAVRASSPGDKLTLTIYREGHRMDVEVTCYDSGK